MKKYLAICFAAFALLFAGVSCVSSNDEEVVLSPYAILKSFSLGNIKSAYPAFTETGEDTMVVRNVSMATIPFTVNQATGEVFNRDSLPFCTDVSKVVATMSVTGVASLYNDSTETYEHFSSTDSLDFTYPRKVRIYSADANYYKDYTLTVNVHQVEPDLMVWSKSVLPAGFQPLRAIEFDGTMRIFGTADNGKAVVLSASSDGSQQWYPLDVTGLDASALGGVQCFAGKLYAVSGGNLYCSDNASDWNAVLQGNGFAAIVGTSDDDGKMWLATETALFSTADAVSVEQEGELPAGFPLYGLSLASYPLNHNKGIIRYMLVGYSTPEMDGKASVWSRISTENKWVEYDNVGNPYACPALKGLAVVRYDNFLFALGGAGTVNGTAVAPFSNFYISRDNGIVWKANTSFYQRLPKELAGNASGFAAAVDSDNYMWVACGGDSAVVWKGIINRLGFKNK